MNREVRMSVTRDRIGKFVNAIEDARSKPCPEGVEPVIRRAEIAGMESMLETLKREYAELSTPRP